MLILYILPHTVSGGKGGPGQAGGNGTIATKVDISNLEKGSRDGRPELDKLNYRTVEVLNKFTCQSRMISKEMSGESCSGTYGVSDKCGSSAGNGGRGGVGGQSGVARLFVLQGAPVVHISNSAGAEGNNGAAGADGWNAPRQRMEYRGEHTYGIMSSHQYSWVNQGSDTDPKCPTIVPGTAGGNAENRTNPPAQSAFNIVGGLLEYEQFVRENQENKLRRAELIAFVDQIHANSDLLHNYTLLNFVEELQTLEQHFFPLKDRIDLAMYYGSLAKRVEEYVRWLNATGVPADTRKVCIYR